MGMEPKNYLELIRPICEYEDNVASGGAQPERGYTVVLSLKRHTTTCDWCNETTDTPNTKIYRRSLETASQWEAKCVDCKKKRVFNRKDI